MAVIPADDGDPAGPLARKMAADRLRTACGDARCPHPMGAEPEPRYDRRRFLSATAMAVAATVTSPAGHGAAQAQRRGGASLGPVRQINAGLLNIGYADLGAADRPAVLLLHGWPYDIHSYAEVAPLLAAAGYRAVVPFLRGYGSTRFLSTASLRNGQPSAVALDAVALMDALNIKKAILAGFDWGARTADIIAALWPERCRALVSVSGYLIGGQVGGKMPLPPRAELEWWYQFYFATERGRLGYEKNRHDFAKLIWHQASPKWAFDDATFDRSAVSLDNPDHVPIVIHNYRWRLDLADGERKYDEFERRLAQSPNIAVPTITMEGDANGAPHPEPASYAKKFAGKYEHRLIAGGIGHNLPQEAPQAFAKAVVDVDRLAGRPEASGP